MRRTARQKALWAAGCACFAVAAACEAAAQRAGWSEGLFKAYYAAGGVLTVAFLGAGSAWLLVKQRARDLMLGGLMVALAAAVIAVAGPPVAHGTPPAAPGVRPPPHSALHGPPDLVAIRTNAFERLGGIR